MARDTPRLPLVEQVREYRRLEEARARRPLTEAEDALWLDLKASLDARLWRQDPVAAANRRQSARVPVKLDVRFLDRPAFRKSYIRNISGGGVFVETDEEIPMGTEVRIRMDVIDRTIECTCVCVWLNRVKSSDFGRGVGFKFLDLTPEEAKFVHEMVFRVMEREATSQEPEPPPSRPRG
jgi:uncharacterized protein (TIGR02266 family)